MVSGLKDDLRVSSPCPVTELVLGHLPCGHVLFNYRPMSSNVSRVLNKSPVTRGHTRIRYVVFIHRFMTLCEFRGRDNRPCFLDMCLLGIKKKTTSVRIILGSVRVYRIRNRYRFGCHCRGIYRSVSRGSSSFHNSSKFNSTKFPLFSFQLL